MVRSSSVKGQWADPDARGLEARAAKRIQARITQSVPMRPMQVAARACTSHGMRGAAKNLGRCTRVQAAAFVFLPQALGGAS